MTLGWCSGDTYYTQCKYASRNFFIKIKVGPFPCRSHFQPLRLLSGTSRNLQHPPRLHDDEMETDRRWRSVIHEYFCQIQHQHIVLRLYYKTEMSDKNISHFIPEVLEEVPDSCNFLQVLQNLREVGELLRRASISKDSNLCVKNCSEG